MCRVFITGDKHGDFIHADDYRKIFDFCIDNHTTKDDVMIVLGDHGTLYYGPHRDSSAKRKLEAFPIRFVMIRGNHDQRPSKKTCQKIHVENGNAIKGDFLVDPEFPSILYPMEFGWYTFAGHPTFIICGAYSIDKQYRLEQQAMGHMGYRWFYDEQLSKTEMYTAYNEFQNTISAMPLSEIERVWIMSHTCPLRYRPNKALMFGIDKSLEDNTMEEWMNSIDDIEVEKEDDDGLIVVPHSYSKWFCGHFHIDELLYKLRFMYHDILELT